MLHKSVGTPRSRPTISDGQSTAKIFRPILGDISGTDSTARPSAGLSWDVATAPGEAEQPARVLYEAPAGVQHHSSRADLLPEFIGDDCAPKKRSHPTHEPENLGPS